MLAGAIQALQFPQGSHGLDAGCGIGLQAMSLARRLDRQDISPGLIYPPSFWIVQRTW